MKGQSSKDLAFLPAPDLYRWECRKDRRQQ